MHTKCKSVLRKKFILPKLSDSPCFTRETEMPPAKGEARLRRQTLLECDTLKDRAIDLKGSPNR